MKENKCKHKHVHCVYSSDDRGWYYECLDCWKTFTLMNTQYDAYRKYKEHTAQHFLYRVN